MRAGQCLGQRQSAAQRVGGIYTARAAVVVAAMEMQTQMRGRAGGGGQPAASGSDDRRWCATGGGCRTGGAAKWSGNCLAGRGGLRGRLGATCDGFHFAEGGASPLAGLADDGRGAEARFAATHSLLGLIWHQTSAVARPTRSRPGTRASSCAMGEQRTICCRFSFTIHSRSACG